MTTSPTLLYRFVDTMAVLQVALEETAEADTTKRALVLFMALPNIKSKDTLRIEYQCPTLRGLV
jgi:hypothetical protein